MVGAILREWTIVRSARARDARDDTPSNDAAVAFADQFPVSEGHLLIVPRRHVSRLEELEPPEWVDLFALVQEVARDLVACPGVDGVNVGLNSGSAAGQTIEHGHVHAIRGGSATCPIRVVGYDM